jgi:O-succinylbenzoate synthase
VPAQQAAALTYRAWVSDGCSTIKVKVAEKGQTLEDDIDRVAAVRAALLAASAHEPRIRIDANGAWSVDAAVSAIRELDQAAGGLEYVEQPCATMTELAAVRARVSVPIAADESIRTAADPILAARTGAADIVVIKVAPLCGVTLALEVAAAAGVPVVVSGAMDSSVGLAGGLAAAAALERLPYACGLGTGVLFAQDLIAEPLRPRGGTLPVVRTEPNQAALERAVARVTPARRDWWLARLERAWFAGADVLVGPLVS